MQEERTSMHCCDEDEEEVRTGAKEKSLVSNAERWQKATAIMLLKQASLDWRESSAVRSQLLF